MRNLKKNLQIAEAALSIPLNELKRYNINVDGRRTSVTLEPRTWEILKEICEEENIHMDDLMELLSSRKGKDSSLASAIRVFLIAYLYARLKYNE
jgi:predicted DNA-binding ribbon-helix-helix protein